MRRGRRTAAEPDRHEWREPPAYRFELDRRTALKLVGAGLFVAVSVDAIGQESGRRGGAGSDEVPDGIAAWIHVRADGAVDVYTGKTEVGQNIRTSLSQAVADELRVSVGLVTMVMADTEQTPFDMGTFGSRTTPYHGAAAPQRGRGGTGAADRYGCRGWGGSNPVEADEGRSRTGRAGGRSDTAS